MTVTVRRADGTPGEGWHLDLADGRRLPADEAGRVRLGGDDSPQPFFGVTLEGLGAAHTPADPSVAAEWVIHLPVAPRVTTPTPEVRTETLTVVAAESGAPLAGAQIDVLAPGWTRTRETDEEGRIVLALLPGPQQVVVGHPDRRPRRVWLHPDRPEPRRIELEASRRMSLAFVDAVTGAPAAIERVRVLAPGGDVLVDTGASASADRNAVDLELGARDAAQAVLEVGGGEYPYVRLPLASAGGVVPLAPGRRILVSATDPRAQPLRDVRLTAYYVPPTLGVGGGLSERVEVAIPGRDKVVLPAGVAAQVRVEAAFSTPRVVPVGEADAGPIVVKLEPSATLPVSVADESGTPLVGATVIVRAEIDGRLLERTARTDADGRVKIPELPTTALEIYAHAKGHAWGVMTAKASRKMDRIEFRLPPGRALRLVAETPLGIPLERVRVRAEPEGDGAPDVVPPHAAPWLTDASGGIVLPDLRDRPYRVVLSHPDAASVRLDGVVPGAAVHFVTMTPR